MFIGSVMQKDRPSTVVERGGEVPLYARFLQVDPVGYDDQFNLYAYVGNDPVNSSDPSGMQCNTGSRTGESVQCRFSFDSKVAMDDDQGGSSRRPDNSRPQPNPAGPDRHLTLSEANRHYRDGTGTPVDVDAGQLSVTLDRAPTRQGETVPSTVNGLGDWLVHGKVPVTLQRDGTFRMVDGPYDFDISRQRSLARNLATRIGRGVATNFGGTGRSFLIRYHGIPRVFMTIPGIGPVRVCPTEGC